MTGTNKSLNLKVVQLVLQKGSLSSGFYFAIIVPPKAITTAGNLTGSGSRQVAFYSFI